MVSETFVYVKVKRELLDRGWTAIAGDSPRGTDLPPLEVKEPDTVHSLRKNANSVIFDLVFGCDDDLLLIECKDRRSKIGPDVEKLRKVCRSPEWRESLVKSLRSGPFLKRFNCDLEPIRSGEALTPCVAHPSNAQSGLEEFVQFRADEGGVDIQIGTDVKQTVRNSLVDNT